MVGVWDCVRLGEAGKRIETRRCEIRDEKRDSHYWLDNTHKKYIRPIFSI